MLYRCALLLLCWVLPLWAAEPVAVPVLSAPVTDLTATLSDRERQQLDARLRAAEAEQGSQLAVLIVPTTQPESLEQYSIRVVEQWRLGRKSVDDGVLLLIATQDREVRIEVGYGLEGALNDAVSSRIIRTVIVPAFREGHYYQGIDAAVTQLLQVMASEALPAPSRQNQRSSDAPWPVLMVGVVLVGSMLRAVLGRLPAAALSGAGAGAFVWWFAGSLLVGLFAALFAFLFVLGGNGHGWHSGRRGGWGAGGGFGGFGGGGWSGGGGGFGGGGASGRW